MKYYVATLVNSYAARRLKARRNPRARTYAHQLPAIKHSKDVKRQFLRARAYGSRCVTVTRVVLLLHPSPGVAIHM